MSGHTDSPPPLAEQARELLLRVREFEAAMARLRAVPTYELSNDGEPLGIVVLADDVLDALRIDGDR